MEIPVVIDNTETLHRRIHPTFIKPDGSLSSQAFTDPEMSVDRAEYRPLNETMDGCWGHGCAAVSTELACALDQDVVADPLLLNPAHALVKGKKTKSIARKLARKSVRVR